MSDQPNPAQTQEQINAQLGQADSGAVAEHMANPAPATDADHLSALQDSHAQLQARVQAIESAIGIGAATAQPFAGLIPGVGAEVSAGLGLVPKLIGAFNELLAEVQQAFSGKVAGHIQPVAPTAEE